MSEELEQEIKKIIFKNINKLKKYAINYHKYKKKIDFNNIDIDSVNNNIEEKSKENNVCFIIDEHSYAKTLPTL